RSRAARGRGATAAARGRTGRCCDVKACSTEVRRPLTEDAIEDESKGIAGKPRAEGIAPCRNRGTAAARSGRAPQRRSARARRGCAPPAAVSAAACAGPGFCVLACLASEDRRAGTETTVEVDHAEAAD